MSGIFFEIYIITKIHVLEQRQMCFDNTVKKRKKDNILCYKVLLSLKDANITDCVSYFSCL